MAGVKRNSIRKKPQIAVRKKETVPNARVLVVDDEKAFAELIQESLEEEGYEITATQDSYHALELLQRSSFDVALVDVRMPKMSGLELLQFFKMRDPRMMVILMTAYGSLALGMNSLHQGAFDYLNKPFSLKTLRDRVREALQRRKQLVLEQSRDHEDEL